jgi:diguanylate cyclase (GGDEF)-like protein
MQNQFSKTQSLNEWSEMIGRIYDGTQNYSKSRYEIHCHLTEVSGAFGKMLFKKNDYEAALQFLPKMFVWAIALFRKVKGPNGQGSDLQEALITKYPRVCSYCLKAPCSCWKGIKPEVNANEVMNFYRYNYSTQDKSVNGIQLMFRTIYGESWGLDNPPVNVTISAIDALRSMHTRMIEELSEVAEALRFYHLYPSNFNNELADYFAWWFALVTNFNRLYNDERKPLFADDILWAAYPAFCLACGLQQCDCRPGPVRELLSKPALNDLALVDGLTQAENQTAFNGLLDDITSKKFPIVLPIACIRIDVDDFKQFNNDISHDAGDNALKTIITLLRQKVRARDRVFRVGGDEFAVLCQDLSSLEAEGMMKRFADVLKTKIIKGKNSEGSEVEKVITLSIGIATCSEDSKIRETFNNADLAAIKSKKVGKDYITRE